MQRKFLDLFCIVVAIHNKKNGAKQRLGQSSGEKLQSAG
jgi:hypothetical protein